MKLAFFSLVLVLASAFPANANANANADDDSVTDVAAKLSSLGFGVELSHRFVSRFGARLGYNTFDGQFDQRYDGILYDVDVGLGSITATLDWYPAGGGFRFSGGVLFNDNKVEALAMGDSVYEIGGNGYQLSDVGTLGGNVKFAKTVPYAGFGWSSNRHNPFGVSIEAGVAFQGAPDVTLTATGDLASNPVFQADIENEESNLRAELSDYEYYPIVALGLSYRF